MGRVRKYGNKWRPSDGPFVFEQINAVDWDEIARDLPPNAPIDAKVRTEVRGHRLRDLRNGRITRGTPAEWIKLADRLQLDAEQCRRFGWGDQASGLDALALEAIREANRVQRLSREFERYADPHQTEFQLGVVWDFRQWGGDVGARDKTPTAALRYFYNVNVAVLGKRFAPKRSSVSKIVMDLKHIEYIEPGTVDVAAAGTLSVDAHVIS